MKKYKVNSIICWIISGVSFILTPIFETFLSDDFAILSFITFAISILLFISGAVIFKKGSNLEYVKEMSATAAAAEMRRQEIDNEINDFDLAIRNSFPELPLPQYEVKDELIEQLNSELATSGVKTNTIQQILMDMERHVGLVDNHKSIVFLEHISEKRAGYIEKHDYSLCEVTVGYNDIYQAQNYIAVLAHEVAHAYCFSKNKCQLFDGLKNEMFTDALTFYLGMGKHTSKGKKVSKVSYEKDKNGKEVMVTRTCTLGYLDEGLFPMVEALSVKLSNELDLQRKEREMNKTAIQKINELRNTYIQLIECVFNTISTNGGKNVDEQLQKEISTFIFENGPEKQQHVNSVAFSAVDNCYSVNSKILKELEFEVSKALKLYSALIEDGRD